MKVMLLAAGKGTRVRPLSLTTPKPMLPIIHKPILEWLIDHLSNQNIKDIIINASYLPEQIENYFADGHQFGVNIGYSWEGERVNGVWEGTALGSAGGMRKVQEDTGFFDETFLVMCADALIDLDFSAAIEFHKQKNALVTLICKKVAPEDVCHYGIAVTDEHGQVSSFQEKPKPEEAKSNMANTGIYIFDPRIFNFIPGKETHPEYDIGSELFPDLVAKNEKIFAFEADFEWVDIGKKYEFWEANKNALLGQYNSIQNYGGFPKPFNCKIDPSAQISGAVYLAPGCQIGANVKIEGPCVIGNNSIVENGAHISNSYIQPHSRVSENSSIKNVVCYGTSILEIDESTRSLNDATVQHPIADCR